MDDVNSEHHIIHLFHVGNIASLTSSGYASQAVSTMTLSAEDFSSVSSLTGSGENDHPQHKLHENACIIRGELDENHNQATVSKAVHAEVCEQGVSDVIEKSLNSISGNSKSVDVNTVLHEDSCVSEKVSTVGINSIVKSQQNPPYPTCSVYKICNVKKDRRCQDKPQDCNPLSSSNVTELVDEKEKLSQMDKKQTKAADCSRHGLLKTTKTLKKLPSALNCNQNDQKQNVTMPKSCSYPPKSKHFHGKDVVIKTSSLMSSSVSSSSSSSSATQNSKIKMLSKTSSHVHGSKKSMGICKELQLPAQSIWKGDLPKQKMVSQRLQEKGGCCKFGQRLDEHISGMNL